MRVTLEEAIQRMSTEMADAAAALGQTDGTRVRAGSNDPAFLERLAWVNDLMADAAEGRRLHVLKEAMSTSDFPYLFGDTLVRSLLAKYESWYAPYEAYTKKITVKDFRTVSIFDILGGRTKLDAVPPQTGYPVRAVSEDTPISVSVAKYGAQIGLDFETYVNDDLGAFRDLPDRLADAARTTENDLITRLYVDANGPHASVYTGGNTNIVTGNPALSTAGLTTAMTVLGAQTDSDGRPVRIRSYVLAVPPALEVAAENIVNAMQIVATEAGGTSGQTLWAKNWLSGRITVAVDPMIPLVATSAGSIANTMWFLMPGADAPRPAFARAYLAGEEQPALFLKNPDATRLGGGPDFGDFETDTRHYKVRHIIGGAVVDPKVSVASQGDGS